LEIKTVFEGTCDQKDDITFAGKEAVDVSILPNFITINRSGSKIPRLLGLNPTLFHIMYLKK